MSEEWRQVGQSDAYEVSSLGSVRCIKSKRGRPTGIKKPTPTNRRGATYFVVTLSDNEGRRTEYLHALVARAFCGPRPSPGHEVAHNNGNSMDCSATNLRWATHAENVADTRAHGTMIVGSRHKASKLTESDVMSIRSQYKAGERLFRLRDKFGVTEGVLLKIIRGQSWRHVAALVGLFMLANCASQPVEAQLATACQQIATAYTEAAILKANGKLSPPRIAAINATIPIAEQACDPSNPPADINAAILSLTTALQTVTLAQAGVR